MWAYSPSSVTLFFLPVKKEGKFVGSKGVGIALYPGMWSRVSERGTLDIVKKKVCEKLGVDCKIESLSPLPVSQGFGLSASASLSTILAIARKYNMDLTTLEMARIAHEVEIEIGGGLGDVSVQITGSVVMRRRAGPTYGDRIPISRREFVAAVLGEKIDTSLMDFDKFVRAGKRAWRRFLREKSLKNAFKVAREFARESGVDSEVRGCIEDCLRYGDCAQIMLGNSVICYGDNDKLVDVLENYGKVYRMRVDLSGIRLVNSPGQQLRSTLR